MALWVSGTNAQRIQGATIVDADGINWFAQDIVQTNEPNFSTSRVMSGGYVTSHRLRSYNGRTGPSGMWQHSWVMPWDHVVDETMYLGASRILGRPVPITMHTRVVDFEWFDGDGSTLDFYLHRQVLGDTYAQSASTGLGVNAGSVVDLSVYNAGTGAAYTVVEYQHFVVVDYEFGDGDQLTLTVDGTSTVLTASAGGAGANEFHGSGSGSNNDTATDLAATINADVSGVSASATGAKVAVVKDAGVETLVLATSDATDYEAHPASGEVAIALGLAPEMAFRNLTFNAAPASTLGNVRVEYQCLYKVAPMLGPWQFTSAHNAESFISSSLELLEIGEGMNS